MHAQKCRDGKVGIYVGGGKHRGEGGQGGPGKIRQAFNSPPRLGAHVGQDDGGADRVAVDVVLGPLRAHHLHTKPPPPPARDKAAESGREINQKARGGHQQKKHDVQPALVLLKPTRRLR